MCKFIGKSNERVLCKLSKKEILRLYSIVHVAMETTKTSNFNRLSKSFISIFFTCQVSACELQPFSCYDLANDIYLQTAKTVFSHLKLITTNSLSKALFRWPIGEAEFYFGLNWSRIAQYNVPIIVDWLVSRNESRLRRKFCFSHVFSSKMSLSGQISRKLLRLKYAWRLNPCRTVPK